MTCEATIGPCHTASPERSDISDGWDGLPVLMRLCIVDTACRLVQGGCVEVWHTNHTGGYSGRIADMCNNDASDVARQFFRGYQRTDANGVVTFETCFPGWYGGRANHVHLRIGRDAYEPEDAAVSWLTTQLLFSGALNAQVFSQAALYRDRGQPDTSLSTGGVVGGETDPSPYLFEVRNVGGVMLASKTLAIRSSLDDAGCEVKGKNGKNGPGRATALRREAATTTAIAEIAIGMKKPRGAGLCRMRGSNETGRRSRLQMRPMSSRMTRIRTTRPTPPLGP